jgi:hypothetical protein
MAEELKIVVSAEATEAAQQLRDAAKASAELNEQMGREPTAQEDALNDLRLAAQHAEEQLKSTGTSLKEAFNPGSGLASGVPDLSKFEEKEKPPEIDAVAEAKLRAAKAAKELADRNRDLRNALRAQRLSFRF